MSDYFTRYDRKKSIRISSLYYHELMGKIPGHERKNYLLLTCNILNKVLHKIKKVIGIEKSDDTKILTDADDKLPNDITLLNNIKRCDINYTRYKKW